MEQNTLSFAEILLQLQKKKTPSENPSPSHNSPSQNTHFSSRKVDFHSEIPLWFSIDPKMRPNQSHSNNHSQKHPKHPYHSKKSLPEKPSFTSPLPKRNPPHKLNEEQAQAYAVFKKFGIVLNTDFTRIELKKSYRTLCFKTHPDRKGSATAFMELKRSYELLLKAIPIDP
jgi:hypothetical protein